MAIPCVHHEQRVGHAKHGRYERPCPPGTRAQVEPGGEFTRKHKIRRLACDEAMNDVKAVIEREKQIKGWSCAQKLARIKTMNPTWKDLSADVG